MLIFLLIGLAPQTAAASSVDLRRSACTTTLVHSATTSMVLAADYRCDSDAPTGSEGWLWLRLDTSDLHNLPAGWTLLIDQTRFDEIAVLVATSKGIARHGALSNDLKDHFAPGGLLKFAMKPPGRDVQGLYLGFRRIDDLSLMRKIVATSDSAMASHNMTWLLLMGVFAGTLLSALLYNVVIHAGQRHAFQRWYLIWVIVSLAYGLTWTNLTAFVLPIIAGPSAVRLDFVLVGLMVAAGNMFFFSVIEEGVLPRWLVVAGRLLAGAGAVLGVMAAADRWLPAVTTDRLLNYVIAATAVVVAVSCWIAARRGSRVIWFYMIGWGPVILVFLARLARNLGFVPQNDFVDMATFAALAFEALVLSLAIADRFRRIRQELDLARKRVEIEVAKTETFRLAAHTDYLTGLGNRAAFQEKANNLLYGGHRFSLFLIDVDHLKEVNDRLGHAGGDTLLRCVGTALSLAVQRVPNACTARIGGDEFAILCPGELATESALAELLRALQGEIWHYADQSRTISLSIGSARYPQDASALDVLYQNADLALYTAKRLGRARHCKYEQFQRGLNDLQIEFVADAEAAIKKGEFELYMQPIVSMTDKITCGYEALLRWNHPQQGRLAPDRFANVFVAERIGPLIQEHVLELALLQLREHGDVIGVLSVNFTSAQLAGPGAAQRVLERLAYHGISASALCVEVTEGVMLDRAADSILANLQCLHDAGVCIALDDFGTGYASLVHLRRVPVDRIKIDRSFISGIDQPDGEALAIVRVIVGLGQGLGKVVVAEGIETESQARRLRQLGCQLGQGFLYGRPAPLFLDGSELIAMETQAACQ